MGGPEPERVMLGRGLAVKRVIAPLDEGVERGVAVNALLLERAKVT
jgi:hypothetical protein